MTDHLTRPVGSAHIEVSAEGQVWRVAVRGDLDCTSADRLRACLRELHRQRAPVVVDLEHVDFVDSAGIGVLVGADRAARRSGQPFSLHSPSRAVRNVLDLSGAEEIAEVPG